MASWKTNIRENFDTAPPQKTDSKPKSVFTPEFDNEAESLGKNADELILMSGTHTAPSVPAKTETSAAAATKDPTVSDQLKELVENPDLYKGTKLFRETVQNLPTAFNNMIDGVAVNSLVDRNIPDKNSPESKKAKDTIRTQFIRYLAILLSYVAVLNWWFIWYYTDFTFNWKSIMDIPIFHIFYYAIEPVCTVLEAINYVILNGRMDADLPQEIRDIMRTLWDYRPITFTAFYFFVTGFLVASPIGKWLFSVMSGSPTGLSLIVMMASILTYVYLNMNTPRLLQFQLQFGNILIVFFVLLLLALFVILFSGLFTPLFAFYLLLISHFSLLLFNGRYVFSKIAEIFGDLAEAPVQDPENKTTFTRLYNFLFRQFHGITVLLIVLVPLFIYNIRELLTAIKSSELIASVILLNIALFAFVAYPFFGTVSEFVGIIVDAIKEIFSPNNQDMPNVAERDVQI